jgi:hypothetical protein
VDVGAEVARHRGGRSEVHGRRWGAKIGGMPDIDDVRSLLADEHGLVVVSTVQSPTRALTSVVNAGIHPHPTTGEDCLAFVSAGSAARLRHIRAGSDVTATARRGWRWIAVTGPAAIVGPDDDGVDAEELRLLLRTVFQAAGGQHEDFDEYDRVMRAERRVAVFVTPARILGQF